MSLIYIEKIKLCYEFAIVNIFSLHSFKIYFFNFIFDHMRNEYARKNFAIFRMLLINLNGKCVRVCLNILFR